MFTMGLASLWEVAEFSLDSLFGMNTQIGGLSDTMIDRVNLGIVKNGTVFTFNGPVDVNSIACNSNLYSYEGRPVLLVTSTSGRYKVMPLVTETFKSEDVKNPDNKAAQRIYKIIDKLASANNYDDVMNALNELRNWLYIPKLYFSSKELNGGYLAVLKSTTGKVQFDNTKGKITLYDPLNPEYVPSKEEKIQAILNLIDQVAAEKPIVYQIPLNSISSDRGYNASSFFLYESGLLKTNFAGTEIYNTNVVSGNELFDDNDKIISEIETEAKPVEINNIINNTSYKEETGVVIDTNNQVVTSEDDLQRVTSTIVGNTNKKPAIRLPQVPAGRAKVAKRRKINTINNISSIDTKGTNNLELSNLNTNFAELNSQYKDILNSKGITSQQWDNANIEERNQLINC